MWNSALFKTLTHMFHIEYLSACQQTTYVYSITYSSKLNLVDLEENKSKTRSYIVFEMWREVITPHHGACQQVLWQSKTQAVFIVRAHLLCLQKSIIKILTFHHILEFELWVAIEVLSSFIMVHTVGGIVRLRGGRDLDKSSIITTKPLIKCERWRIVSF